MVHLLRRPALRPRLLPLCLRSLCLRSLCLRSLCLRSLCLLVALVVAVVAGVAETRAAGRGEPGPWFEVRVELSPDDRELTVLRELDLDIETVRAEWARVHVTAAELRKIEGLGLRATRLPVRPHDLRPPGSAPGTTPGTPPATPKIDTIPAEYHTYETLTAELEALAAAHPDLTRLHSAGQSVEGRELWIMEITDNPDVEEDEPEVSYLSSIHGNEVVGKELVIGLIRHLLEGHGTDPRLTALVDETEIWIMPSVNPDGTAAAQRYNIDGFDLNRSFPDLFSDPVDTPGGRPVETAAIMGWSRDRRVSLAANFHCGELVVNYPFDNNPGSTDTYSPTLDEDEFYSIARTYADANPPLRANNSHPAFIDGVTNGADWYAIDGGMQDWNYVWHTGFEVTLEVSTENWPAATELPQFWSDNVESMVAYLERAHEGIRGIVTDAETGAPLQATVWVDDNPFPAYTDPDLGDYHRLLFQGPYDLLFTATGYESHAIPAAAVPPGVETRHDVALWPLGTELVVVDARLDDGPGGPGGDGWLDAGETADLLVTVGNLGRTATNVQGRLVPTGMLADVTRADAAFPDVPPGGEGEALAPGHEIRASAAAPPGPEAGFALEWTSDQGTGWSAPFFLPLGAPACEAAAGTDLPQPLDNRQPPAVSTVTLTEDRRVTSVRVTVDLTHAYIGDLTVDLRSPAGTTVRLHDRSGGGATDLVGTWPDDWSPAQSLAAFAGEISVGDWTLEITDRARNDQGELLGWSIDVCGRPAATATPEIRFRSVVDSPAGVVLDWWTQPAADSYRLYRATSPRTAAAFLDATAADPDPTDTTFTDGADGSLVFYLVTGVGPLGEGPKGHFGE